MQYSLIKSILTSALLLSGTIAKSYAGEINLPSVRNDNVNPQIEISKIPKEKTDSTQKTGELPSQHKSRAPGNAIIKHNSASSNEEVLLLKKRLEELEQVVEDQNKLIQLYKQQQN